VQGRVEGPRHRTRSVKALACPDHRLSGLRLVEPFLNLSLATVAYLTILLSTALSANAGVERIEVPGGTLDVWLEPSHPAPAADAVHRWIESAARAVVGYYGVFPVSKTRVLVRWVDGRGVRHGTTYENLSIHLSVGRETEPSDFEDDWVLTHEMIHLAFPAVGRDHNWIHEGLATYVEPIARAHAGQLPIERIWADLVHGLPQGIPGRGDRGLDQTHTWGRTYWGGALFFLLADVEIRERTNNVSGLQDALRAIVAAGGTLDAEWEPSLAFQIGDRATGVPVLSELYEKMKATPVHVDLDRLWVQLGVKPRGAGVVFDDAAPLAAVRRAIASDASSDKTIRDASSEGN